MHELFELLKILAICATALVALTLILIVVISQLPKNPLRLVLIAFARRLGITAGGLALIPMESLIPVAGEIGDIVTIAVIAYTWYTLVRDLKRIQPQSRPEPINVTNNVTKI